MSLFWLEQNDQFAVETLTPNRLVGNANCTNVVVNIKFWRCPHRNGPSKIIGGPGKKTSLASPARKVRWHSAVKTGAAPHRTHGCVHRPCHVRNHQCAVQAKNLIQNPMYLDTYSAFQVRTFSIYSEIQY
jgi:hypothetical protein